MDAATDNSAIQTDGQPENMKRLERSWFWIALIALLNLYYTLGATTSYFNMPTGLHDKYPLFSGSQYALAAIGLFLVPILFKRLGIFDDPHKYKTVFYMLSTAGVLAIAGFSAIFLINMETSLVWLAVILEYISVFIPAVIAGHGLHRAVKVIRGKSIAAFCGLSVLLILVIAIAHKIYLNTCSSFEPIAVSFIIIYVLMLMIPVVLLIVNKDKFEYTALKNTAYFSGSLFGKFMILAVLMAVLTAFNNAAYYGGGSYDNFSDTFSFTITFLPVIIALGVVYLLRKSKWMAVAVASMLFLCFQQGLILFFNDNSQLAYAYALMGVFSDGSLPVFMLFIPLMYGLQKRENAIAATGVVSLYCLMDGVIAVFMPAHYGASAIVTPGITFVLSIAAIAYLFYLYGENNRVYVAALIAEFQSRDIAQVSETVSKADALEKLNLTPREREVCALLLKSMTLRQISAELGMAFNTVNTHYRSLYKKLGIGSKAELFMRFGAEPAAEADGEATNNLVSGNSI